ncbi:hypothetical protein [Teredinibacter franksiae]|uniref:hypothetical protein n=1 Tax=Teredinibacter franksiae TaxID=2761453 RepID=UPI00162499A1|nr:hypothetical protein [Teredinibacter franksiae]
MEVKIQKCQNCQSRNLRNVLVRDELQKVFVQCRDCGGLVARYLLSKGGYFHAGRGFESFLRSLERDGDMMSGRNINTNFEDLENQIDEEYKELTNMMTDIYGEKLP